MSCHVISYHIISCHVMSCHVISCHVILAPASYVLRRCHLVRSPGSFCEIPCKLPYASVTGTRFTDLQPHQKHHARTARILMQGTHRPILASSSQVVSRWSVHLYLIKQTFLGSNQLVCASTIMLSRYAGRYRNSRNTA